MEYADGIAFYEADEEQPVEEIVYGDEDDWVGEAGTGGGSVARAKCTLGVRVIRVLLYPVSNL